MQVPALVLPTLRRASRKVCLREPTRRNCCRCEARCCKASIRTRHQSARSQHRDDRTPHSPGQRTTVSRSSEGYEPAFARATSRHRSRRHCPTQVQGGYLCGGSNCDRAVTATNRFVRSVARWLASVRRRSRRLRVELALSAKLVRLGTFNAAQRHRGSSVLPRREGTSPTAETRDATTTLNHPRRCAQHSRVPDSGPHRRA